MLRIRLARGGAKKKPFYSIVVANARSPRDGAFIEKLGYYDPFLEHSDPKRVVLNEERIKHWLSVGAQPSERVELFLSRAGLCPNVIRQARPKKSAPKAKAMERMREMEEKQAAENQASEA